MRCLKKTGTVRHENEVRQEEKEMKEEHLPMSEEARLMWDKLARERNDRIIRRACKIVEKDGRKIVNARDIAKAIILEEGIESFLTFKYGVDEHGRRIST